MALGQNTGRQAIATFLLLANGRYSAVLYYILFNINYLLKCFKINLVSSFESPCPSKIETIAFVHFFRSGKKIQLIFTSSTFDY